MKMCHFGISDQAFCLFSLVQVYCCEYNKKFWNSQPKTALFWKCKNMLMSAHILGIFFLKWLLNLCYPLQKTVVPQNILILPPNIENKWKKSFLEQSKLCPCWGTVPPPLRSAVLWHFRRGAFDFGLWLYMSWNKFWPKKSFWPFVWPFQRLRLGEDEHFK